MTTRTQLLVIPCYNEGQRFDAAHVAAIIANSDVGVVLVDDGSRDDTLQLLGALQSQHPDAVSVLSLPKNKGKGEAVRAGMLHAIAMQARTVGYADADFSTPPAELLRLLALLKSTEHRVVLGTRFARLGAQIQRKRSRHYLGRVFATLAAVTLDLVVYDTQCGAKWFAVTDSLEHALVQPFHTRWAFDVELIGRLIGRFGDGGMITKVSDIIEEPLLSWADVGGSKLSVLAMGKAFFDLLRLLAEARR